MNVTGNQTRWRVIQGRPDFFSVAKKIHNALLGADINLSKLKMQIYQDVCTRTRCNYIDHDFVIVHDPQPRLWSNSTARRDLGSGVATST